MGMEKLSTHTLQGIANRLNRCGVCNREAAELVEEWASGLEGVATRSTSTRPLLDDILAVVPVEDGAYEVLLHEGDDDEGWPTYTVVKRAQAWHVFKDC